MNLRRIYPLAMGAFLLIVASTSEPATASIHCNNKICSSATTKCVDQTDGPDTHCIDKATPKACVWDFCPPH